jgi:hypothetical protein
MVVPAARERAEQALLRLREGDAAGRPGWSLLLFPLLGLVAWRGLLLVALGFANVAALLVAVGYLAWEGWRIGRLARRARWRRFNAGSAAPGRGPARRPR